MEHSSHVTHSPSNTFRIMIFIDIVPHHTTFTYWVLGRYQAPFGVIAENPQGSIVGFITGIGSAEDAVTIYVWQVGVASNYRRCGIASQLLEELCLSLI